MKKMILFLAFCALMAGSYFYSGPVYRYYMYMYYVKFKRQSVQTAAGHAARLYDAKKYDELEDYSRDMLLVYPDSSDLKMIAGKNDLRRGEALLTAGDRERGLGLRRRGADRILTLLGGQSPAARVLEDAVQVYFEDGQFRDIISVLKERDLRGEQNLLYYYGVSLLMTGEDRRAASALEAAIREGRTDYTAYYYLGLAYEKTNPSGALNNLEEAYRLNFRNTEIKKALARIYRTQGKSGEAEKMIRKGKRR